MNSASNDLQGLQVERLSPEEMDRRLDPPGAFVFSVWMHGIPATKGSKRILPVRTPAGAPPRYVQVEANQRLGSWQQTLSDLMAKQAPRTPIYRRGCPVALFVRIFLPRPKSHYLKSGKLREVAPDYPTVKPDLSKVMRAIEDAGTSIWWDDDRQIVLEWMVKKYARELVGVEVSCRMAAVVEAIPIDVRRSAKT